MRMRSRWRLSVVLILASTSVATWLLVNRETGAKAVVSPATSPTTLPIKPAVVAVGIPASAPTSEPTSKPSVAAAVGDTSAVTRGTLTLAFDFDGVFEPVDPFELKLKVRSYQGDFVVVKAVTPSTPVKKGDSLLELDPQKIDVQIAAAENELTGARAALVKAEADIKLGDAGDALAMTSAKDELAISQTELKRWDDMDGPATVLAGGMEIKQVQASLDDAVDELNELKKMYKSEDLTNQTADIVMKRAARGVELQKISADIAKAGSDRAQRFTPVVSRQHLVDTVDQHAQTIANLGASQAQSRVLRAMTLFANRQSVDEGVRKLTELKQDRTNFSITSPVDGVVVYGIFAHKAWQEMDRDKFAVDSKLPADQVVMTVFTPGKLRVRTEWPEAQITLLTPDLKAKISSVATPELEYIAVPRQAMLVGAAKGDGQAFDVPMDLPPVDPRLVPGYKANVSVDAGKVENVLLVPNTAVYRGKVWVHKPGGDDEVRPVTVGRTDGKQTEIRAGLNEVETVLTQAKHPGAT